MMDFLWASIFILCKEALNEIEMETREKIHFYSSILEIELEAEKMHFNASLHDIKIENCEKIHYNIS